MSLKVSASDGVKVYTVSGGKNVPSWLSDKKKKSLRKDEEYRRRVELIQDFEFPAACQRLKLSPDGQYIFATGYHAPRVRVYDVNQLSMKFERHFDAEIVDFQILSEDYSKVAFLCTDRTINLHARFGSHYKVRVPKFGRDLAFCPFTAELLVASSSPEVFRLSLEEGRFLTPLTTRAPAVNACGIAPAHGLLACAGEDGGLECFDLRQRGSLGWLDAAAAAGGRGQGLTAVRFDASGMHVAVGTSGGLVALFDLRSQRPIVVKDHMYDSPIKDIKFHTNSVSGAGASAHVISADRHVIKVWDAATGEGYTNIEPADGTDINDVCVWPGSGLIMAACDSPRMQAFFVPSLGPAPRWCSFLESLTEELEESANPTVYDDYRFITRQDLDKLGLGHLVGTSVLRAYMHGFFIDNRLYQKARAIADPFAYDTYRQKRVAAKVEEERKSRISIVRKLPKVNAATAARLLAEQEQQGKSAAAGGGRGGKAAVPNLLEDDRFKAMFEDKEFAVDEGSLEYQQLHPNTERVKDRKLRDEHFEPLAGDAQGGSASEGGGGSSEGGSSDEEEEDTQRRQRVQHRDKRLKDSAGGEVRVYAAKDEVAAAAYMQGRSLAPDRERPLSERAAAAASQTPTRTFIGGSRELKFVPRMRPDDDGGRGGGAGVGRGRGGFRGGGRGGGGDSAGRGRGGGRGGGRGMRGRGGGGRGGGGGGRRGGGGGRGGGRGGRGRGR